ncbi:MAG: hypothetical protein AAFP82_18565 [Bacteroidota bacterium]
MTVTFNLHTAEDYDWLIHVLKSFQNKNLNIQINDDIGLSQIKKREQFLDYFASHPIKVDKIEIPSRDERNRR